MFDDQLGEWLEQQRRRPWRYFKLLLAVLALLVAINVFVRPEHPHFPLETIPGFWAVFGLVAAVGMSLVLKKLASPLLRRPEEPDGD
jgi:peptidoglycan/LPS O-acetylase OafA/YrhL